MSHMGNMVVEAIERENLLGLLRREYGKFVGWLIVQGFFYPLNERECSRCGWKGMEHPDCFGHHDFYCPECGAEALK